MNYKSFADLSKDIKSNLHKIPKDVSLIVGIPRSGLLAANLISLYTNLPLTDIDNFIDGKVLCSSYQLDSLNHNALKGKILIVDDSVATGKAIIDAKQKLKTIIEEGKYNLLFCCVYADPEKKDLVDIPLQLLNRPRLFEWNLFHNKIMEKSCVYMDGILAMEKKLALTEYMAPTPFIIPKKKIATILASGNNKDKSKVEGWLKKNNIQFNELVMIEALDEATEYKKRKQTTLLLINNTKKAKSIFENTGKDVYCFESNQFFSKKQNNIKFSLKSTLLKKLNKIISN